MFRYIVFCFFGAAWYSVEPTAEARFATGWLIAAEARGVVCIVKALFVGKLVGRPLCHLFYTRTNRQFIFQLFFAASAAASFYGQTSNTDSRAWCPPGARRGQVVRAQSRVCGDDAAVQPLQQNRGTLLLLVATTGSRAVRALLFERPSYLF